MVIYAKQYYLGFLAMIKYNSNLLAVFTVSSGIVVKVHFNRHFQTTYFYLHQLINNIKGLLLKTVINLYYNNINWIH